MPYKPFEIEGMLIGKLKMSTLNADHKWFFLQLQGLPPIRTKLPNHKEDIGIKLESRIFKQLRVRKTFFHELMDCTKTLPDYEKMIREDPYPPLSNLLV